MIRAEPDTSWQQHFPTYAFRERDVVLEEYRAAAKTLEAEERIFLNASNIAIIAAAGLGSLTVGSLGPLARAFEPILIPELTLAVLLALVGGFAIVVLRYFADRQKALVFAARKVIVLRRMLGLSYGRLQLVLPNWRIEGADEPFAVRLFPGWNTYVTYPLFMIGGISSAVILFISAALSERLLARHWVFYLSPTAIILSSAAAWSGFAALVYRKALLDTHERMLLLFTRILARLVRLRLVTNFEYVIYRARLAGYELHRVGIDLEKLKKTLVFIEDRTFFDHPGVSLRGSVRAVLGIIGLKRASGGSTITQQLVRTLFIQELTKLVRRKLIELLLALWFDRVISKENQLDLYLAAVRFDRGIFGVPAAMRHFFGELIQQPSAAQAFFLIERVSNVQSRLMGDKVASTLQAAISSGVCSEVDAEEVVQLYERAVASGKIVDGDQSSLSRLRVRMGSRPTKCCY